MKKDNLKTIFLIWVLFILVVSLSSYIFFTQGSLRFDVRYFYSLANWDGSYFLEIAKNGYINKNHFAFFPLYPLSIGLISKLTHLNVLFVGILINLLSLIGSLVLLKKLLLIDYPGKITEETITYLLIFPTSFYILTIYSESLFLFLSLGAFYFTRRFLKKQKLKYLALGILFAIFASATRLVGAALVIALWLEFLQKNKDIKTKLKWLILFMPAGLMTYLIFLYNQTGSATYFLTSQQNWQRGLTVPVLSIWQSIEGIINNQILAIKFPLLYDLLFTIFGLGIVIRSFRFLRTSYAVYALISILLPLFTNTLMSMPRFLVVIFPIFLTIALLKNKTAKAFYIIISVLLLSLNLGLFINGFWVS